MTTLKNKVAIVTGSSKGIGAQIALSLAESGAKTVINYANDDVAANDIVSQIKSAGGEARMSRRLLILSASFTSRAA